MLWNNDFEEKDDKILQKSASPSVIETKHSKYHSDVNYSYHNTKRLKIGSKLALCINFDLIWTIEI